jgi:hypothetical protein
LELPAHEEDVDGEQPGDWRWGDKYHVKDSLDDLSQRTATILLRWFMRSREIRRIAPKPQPAGE